MKLKVSEAEGSLLFFNCYMLLERSDEIVKLYRKKEYDERVSNI